MIRRIQLHPPTSNENRAANVKLMAQGVNHAHCIYVGAVQFQNVTSLDNSHLKPGEYFSSVELYDNGGYNLNIHDADHNFIAFLRVRSE